MPDLHNHTPYCHHASGEPSEYIDRARNLGIREYGFAEHSPWMLQYDGEQIAPTPQEFECYLRDLEELRAREKKLGQINLRIGIEMDFIPEKRETAFAMAESYPFDFHVGSVHNIGNWIFDHPDYLDEWNNRKIDEVFQQYFAALKDMLLWNRVDILGHLDLPKKFGHVPPGGYDDLVTALLPLIVESEVVVEINTAGKDKPIGEFYPSRKIVEKLARARVPMTIGSDAHKPSEVGRHRGEALGLLRECGVKEIISFSGRRKVGIRI